MSTQVSFNYHQISDMEEVDGTFKGSNVGWF